MAYIESRDRNASAGDLGSQFRNAIAVTPSDTVDLNPYAKALWVGVAGNLSVVLAGDKGDSGTPVLFTNIPVGWFPGQVRRVMNTLTTATTMIAVYD